MIIHKIKRRILHLHKSGCFVRGVEHFLVMFPSAMLIARLANTAWGSVIELPAVLFACGMGTLLFSFLTKGQIPFFLGPSFSYIGFVSYQVASITSSDDIYVIRSTIFYGYLIAGIILLLLCWIYHHHAARKVLKAIFPSTVMGPAISLIGLELATMAAQDSGFSGGNLNIQILAILTLTCIIIFSLFRHHFLHNASILIGVLVGCIAATITGQVTWPATQGLKILIPEFYFSHLLTFPEQWITLTFSVFPCALIAFVESLGRLEVYEGMLKRDDQPVNRNLLSNSISTHAFTSILSSISSMMPSAIYAENLAVMNLHSAELSTRHRITEDDDSFVVNCYSTYSIYPYVIGSLLSISVAMISGLQELFLSIPMPILGGMELFVFGLISAPGIQMLVDQQVNYKKISNQIITSSVFLAGVSNISITYGSLTLRGMSLGLTIGVVVNLVAITLGYFGYLNEAFTVSELLNECIDTFDSPIALSIYNQGEKPLDIERDKRELKSYVRRRNIIKMVNTAHKITLSECSTKRVLVLQQGNGRIELKVSLPKPYKNALINDNQQIIAIDEMNKAVTIVVDECLSKRLLRDILNHTI